MDGGTPAAENRCMDKREKTANATTPPTSNPVRSTSLKAQIEQRDETIRLLNEALSQALDELNALRLAA
jgi:hypothetical protein